MAWRVLGAALALAWCLRAAQHRETFTYSFDIDPGEVRYFDVLSKQPGARLQLSFEVASPEKSSGVRVAVESEKDFGRLRGNLPHQEMMASAYRPEGALRARLPEPGRYFVVIDNQKEARRRSRVEMEVNLITGPDPETLPVGYASPQKRLVVVSVSVIAFLCVLAASGAALWRSLQRPPVHHVL
jgi:hypothetical protein